MKEIKNRKIWIICDTHLGHQKLTDEYDFRPQGFSDIIIKNCINTISCNDILIHLGDVCFGKAETNEAYWHKKFFEFLPCKKILVRGNHDHKSDNWYYDHGWDFVCKQFISKHFGKKILFSHIPQERNNYVDFNIHGHSHGNSHRDEEYCDYYEENYHKEVALEKTGYKPITLEWFVAQW